MTDRLVAAREAAKAAREERAAQGIPQRKSPAEKLADNPTSLRAAINANCFQCVGSGADPGWQWAIGNCTTSCPLYRVRPFQRLHGADAPQNFR